MASTSASAIMAFWESRALDIGSSEDLITHRDRNQRLLEIDLVLQDLPNDARILDVGCGNGFSTGIFAKHAKTVVGIDYSPAMIERANKMLADSKNVELKVQDVLALDLPAASFDVAISQRCLINLTSWATQQRAIANVAQVLRPGGVFFLQEGSQQGRENLNQLRETLGLSRMPPVAFNLDFDEDKLWPYVQEFFEVAKVRRLGVYDLISRVVHPLMVSPLEPQYDAPINKVAGKLGATLDAVGNLAREFSAVMVRRGS